MATATATASRRAAALTVTPRISHSHSHSFHTTPRALIKPGDPLPDTDALMESHPGQRVNLAEEAQKFNNMLLIGVPAAFSPACSATHIPGYANHPRKADFEMVGVVSVNDVFV
jgi:2-Cys peroxiredoxin 5